MPGIPAARVVAIIADMASGRTQFGTGYLLDAAHVLTARHCVIDRETGQPAASLRVTRASDGAVAFAGVSAATEQDLDIALLSVTGEPPWGTHLPGGPVVFGKLDREYADQLDGCEAAGFPRWQENEIGDFRDVAEVHGLIRVLEGRESQRLVLRDPVLGGVAADSGSAWAGFSGAAVFHGGLLLGVVIEHHARQGDTSLQIRPVEAIAQADDTAARELAEALGLGRDGSFLPVTAGSTVRRGEMFGEATPAPDPDVTRVGMPGADATESSDRGPSDIAVALTQRFHAEWAADIALINKLKERPSFQDASAALRQCSELNLISKHGVRGKLENSSTFLRIPRVDDWPNYPAIPLHVETRWLENILVHEWTPGQSFIDMIVSIAAKLRSTPYWTGEGSYRPDATFAHLADLLLYGVDMIREGLSGEINRIFQVVGDDWVIAEWELIDKTHHYQIDFRTLHEANWVSHVTEKIWVDKNNFIEAFGTAQMLVHNRIFDGRLPEGWAPPNTWPFKTSLGGFILDL